MCIGDRTAHPLLTAVNDPSANVTQIVFGDESAFRELALPRGRYNASYDEDSDTLGIGIRLHLGDSSAMVD